MNITRLPNGRYELSTDAWLPRPLDDVFSFFADAGNLERLTPWWLKFRIITPRPIDMRAGTIIDYRLRVRGVPIRWQSEITVWQPPHRFVDEQRRGPYRVWIHEHTFADEAGGTRARDRVEYAVPGGTLVHKLFVGPDLRRIFSYRGEAMRQMFSGGL